MFSRRLPPTKRQMSVQKPTFTPDLGQKPISRSQAGLQPGSMPPFSKRHNPRTQVNLQGINTVAEHYVAELKGTAGVGGHLWSLNLSTSPADHRRLISLVSGGYMLLNYGSDDFPATLFIFCNQLTGMTDQDGTNNGVVGYMVPKSPAIPVLNDGGIIGWNVCYQLADFAPTFDITGLPSLTFDIGTKSDKTQPIQYPLNQAVCLGVIMNHVQF